MSQIVSDEGWVFKFRLSQNFIDFMIANRCYTDAFSGSRWKKDEIITCGKDTDLRKYWVLLTGHRLPKFGCCSYSFSSFDVGVSIGNYCSISWNVRVMGPSHPMNFITSSEILYRKDTMLKSFIDDYTPNWRFDRHSDKSSPKLGHDVWIGQDVLLAKGITLGNGCVVGAGSIVTKDVPPYAIVAGVPARLIKFRFPDDTREALMRSEWWNYALPSIPDVPRDNIGGFLKGLNESIISGEAKRLPDAIGRVFDLVQEIG